MRLRQDDRELAARGRLLRALGIGGMVLALIGVLCLTEAPLCPFAYLTGVPCPGCGFTRATLALLRGDISSALHFHPLVPVAPILVFWASREIIGYVRGKAAPPIGGRFARKLLTGVGVLLVVAFVTVWILRFGGALGGPVSVRAFWQPQSLADQR